MAKQSLKGLRKERVSVEVLIHPWLYGESIYSENNVFYDLYNTIQEFLDDRGITSYPSHMTQLGSGPYELVVVRLLREHMPLTIKILESTFTAKVLVSLKNGLERHKELKLKKELRKVKTRIDVFLSVYLEDYNVNKFISIKVMKELLSVLPDLAKLLLYDNENFDMNYKLAVCANHDNSVVSLSFNKHPDLKSIAKAIRKLDRSYIKSASTRITLVV